MNEGFRIAQSRVPVRDGWDEDVTVLHRQCGGADGFLDGEGKAHCPFCASVELCDLCGEQAVPVATKNNWFPLCGCQKGEQKK